METEKKNNNLTLNIIITLVVLVGGLFVVNWIQVESARVQQRVREGLEPTSYNVVYRVKGTAQLVDVTMRNQTGNTEQISNVKVPNAQEYTMERGDFVYISAQNQGETGSVTCEIEVNGVVVETATSTGEFVIATCSGSVGR